MMRTEELKSLLERYYRGETTLPEEQLLKSLLLQNDVPEELEEDRKTFLFLSDLSQQEAALPSGLQERLAESISRWEAADTRQPRPKAGKPAFRLMRWCTGIAAALLIATGAGLYIQKTTDRPHDTFDNPQLAYAEAQQALQRFATALNKGQNQLSKAEGQTLRIKEQLDKCRNALADTPKNRKP